MGTPQVLIPHQSLIKKLPYWADYGKSQLQVISTDVPSSQMTLAYIKLKEKSQEERKENKERLKSSHRQAHALGVLSQARNYRTGSTAKCFIKGNSLPNSWRWSSASCVCLLVSFFSLFSYLHLSISCSLALCIGKCHIQISLEQRNLHAISN